MKNFSNENGVTTGGAGGMIAFFSVSLLFTSMLISFIMLNAYGVVINPITLPELTSSASFDFANSNLTPDSMLVSGAAWNNVPNSGEVSTGTDSYLFFKNVIPADFKYYDTYTIYNPNQQDYSLVLEKNSMGITEIIVSSDGFHIPAFKTGKPAGGYFYPYAGANKIQTVSISTVYFRPSAGTVNSVNAQLIFNGQTLFNVNDVAGYSYVSGAYYGGIGSKNNIGLVLRNYLTQSGDTKTNDWGGIITAGVNFFNTLISILVWNIDSQYFPWILNLILIKSQIFCLAVGIIWMARG